jgi:hypothetical protein
MRDLQTLLTFCRGEILDQGRGNRLIDDEFSQSIEELINAFGFLFAHMKIEPTGDIDGSMKVSFFST